MFEEIAASVPDVTVLRRLLFAAVHIPKSTPRYSELVTDFAYGACEEKPVPESVRVLLENIEFLSKKAFDTDSQLLEEIIDQKGVQGHPIGIVLIPENKICMSCGGVLRIRSDRPTFLTLYTDDMGTVPATLFHKYCSNSHKGCTFTQYYGFHSFNETSESVADSNWAELPYFVSTHKTGFSLSFLRKFDAELLLGQMSYNQKSDIYNFYHKYEKIEKKLSSGSTKKAKDLEDDVERYTYVLKESIIVATMHIYLLSYSRTVYNRACLDRRRLEEAHLKYAVLCVYQRYPHYFTRLSIDLCIRQTLEDITPLFYRAFSARYACKFIHMHIMSLCVARIYIWPKAVRMVS